MAKRKSPRLCAVHWLDAAGDRDDEQVEPVHACTFGFLVADEKDFIRIAGEIFEDGSYREVTAIPKGMVKAILYRPIRLPNKFRGWGHS